jgi:hypothetical protein
MGEAALFPLSIHPPSLPHSLLRGKGVFVFTMGKVMAE